MDGGMAGQKRAAFIVASKDFRDEEYFIPNGLLSENGIATAVFSDKSGTALGVDGNELENARALTELNPNDFDAVIFIGGPGALARLDNETSYVIASKTVASGKLLAAICVAPVILAHAGALKNKQATVWTNVLDVSAKKTLVQTGAIYIDKPVVQDGAIITANGPEAAQEFGMAIVAYLKPAPAL
jgi:protease I